MGRVYPEDYAILRGEKDVLRRELEDLHAEHARVVEERDRAIERAESAEFGCEIAYRREPTQADGDAHDPSGSGECFVAMGGWTGCRCRICRRWAWGGPTVCLACVTREEMRERAAKWLRARAAALRSNPEFCSGSAYGRELEVCAVELEGAAYSLSRSLPLEPEGDPAIGA